MARLLQIAMATLVVAFSAQQARGDTLAYDTTTRVVTVTLTVTSPYVEIGAESDGAHVVVDPNGFASVPAGCTVSGSQYRCGSPPSNPVTMTVVRGTPGVDTVIGLTHAFTTPSNYNPPIEVDLGAGNDVVQAGDGNDVIATGDGDDVVTNYLGDDRIDGGAGADKLTGGANADGLTGGPGRDVLAGGAGKDALDGGADADDLDGGPGPDWLSGGAGLDTVSYETRTAGVSVTLDGQANDGETGENDSVSGDLERIVTGAGPDQVTGDAAGHQISTGPGNDTVTVRNGAVDAVDCGDDADALVGDQLDFSANCENAQLTRDLQPDADGDGIAAPADCDDRNPARRPGFPDVAGNGVDEDCSGADTPATVAPLTRVPTSVLSQFSTARGRTKVVALTLLDLPAGATAELRCAGGRKSGCFRGVKRKAFAKGAPSARLAGLVKGKLRRGATLELRILAPGRVGRVFGYTMRAKAKAPTPRLRCLTPGAAKPTTC